MRIGLFEIKYLAHVCFIFRSQAGKTIITDPFFGDGFEHEGHYEKYLSPPHIKASEIKKCDALFISHIHSDHYDPAAVLEIQKNTKASIIAPQEVITDLLTKGADAKKLFPAEEGKVFTFGDITAQVYCGYDNSFDSEGLPNKFALVIKDETTRFFYSGDCHELPTGVKNCRFDAIFCWPMVDNETKIRGLCEGLKTSRFVMMHGDRFEPGNFFCNRDLIKDAKKMKVLFPDIEVINPERIIKL